MDIALKILVFLATLAAGLFMTIKPEKAQWVDNPPKALVIAARVTGIVVLTLLAAVVVIGCVLYFRGELVL